MNTSQDCKETRHRIIAVFCHDFGAISGNLAGYTSILDLQAKGKFDDNPLNIPEFVDIMQTSRRTYESHLQSMIEYVHENTNGCESSVSDILTDIDTMYDNHFLKWYNVLADLQKVYTNNGHLDTNLIQKMTFHAENLLELRNRLIGEIHLDL